MTDILIIKAIAWFYIALSAGMLINHNQYKKLLESFLGSRALLFLSALIGFFVGFVLVAVHNTWGISWQNSVVSAVGWAILAKSVIMLVFPGFGTSAAHAINYQKNLTIIGSVIGIIGVALIFLTR